MNARDSRTELVLTVAAFVLAAVPVWLVVFGGASAMASMGVSVWQVMNQPPDPAMKEPMMKAIHYFMSWYIMDLIVPAVIGLGAIWAYAAQRFPRLANRMAAGAAAGFVTTVVAGEPVRLAGVAIGAFPADMPGMFGMMIAGRMSSEPQVMLAGYIYHIVLNGSTFGLMYALLAGKIHWAWGVPWLLFFELGMMTLPPVPMMFGPFGIYGAWPGLFLASLAVHIVFGIVLGVLAQRWIRDPGTIFSLIGEALAPAEQYTMKKAR